MLISNISISFRHRMRHQSVLPALQKLHFPNLSQSRWLDISTLINLNCDRIGHQHEMQYIVFIEMAPLNQTCIISRRPLFRVIFCECTTNSRGHQKYECVTLSRYFIFFFSVSLWLVCYKSKSEKAWFVRGI